MHREITFLNLYRQNLDSSRLKPFEDMNKVILKLLCINKENQKLYYYAETVDFVVLSGWFITNTKSQISSRPDLRRI